MTTKQASTEGLKNKLANQANQAPAAAASKAVSPYRKVEAYLNKMAPQLQAALPDTGITAERLSRITLTTIKMNPALLEANIDSLLGGVMQAAQLGLEPNLMGSCYLIPYKDRRSGVTTVSFQIGYRGLIDLVTRSKEVLYVEAMPVYKGDEFRAIKGTRGELYHQQMFESEERPEDITHFYAYAKMKNGETIFRVMSAQGVNKIRDRHSKSYQYQKNDSIWGQHYEAMGCKTVLKQLCKWLPISVDTQSAIASDETVRKDITEPPAYIDPVIIEHEAEQQQEPHQEQPALHIINE